jgi:hypothetical protein
MLVTFIVPLWPRRCSPSWSSEALTQPWQSSLKNLCQPDTPSVWSWPEASASVRLKT